MKPIISSNQLVLVGDLGELQIEGASNIDVEMIPITDKRLQNTWKHEIYRLRITASKENLQLIIKIIKEL